MNKHTGWRTLLGMSGGSANNRMRNNVVFRLAGKLDMLTCFRCGQPITSVGDLSYDHIKEWRKADDPASLFFDAENIAFSHRLCNFARLDPGDSQALPGVRPAPWRKGHQKWVASVYSKNGRSRRYFYTQEEANRAYWESRLRFRGK